MIPGGLILPSNVSNVSLYLLLLLKIERERLILKGFFVLTGPTD